MRIKTISGDDVCPSCLRTDVPLVMSHAINNAFFRRLKRGGNFCGISIEKNRILRMQKSFESKLLCSDCEKLFNNDFDRYSIRQFDSFRKELDCKEKPTRRVSVEDAERLARYLISVLWRSYHIDTGPYQLFDVPINVFYAMERVVKGSDCPFTNFSYNFRQANGPRGPMNARVLTLPRSYTAKTCRSKGERIITTMTLTLMGIEMLVIFGKNPHPHRFCPGILRKNQKSVFIPKFYFMEDPSLVAAICVAMNFKDNHSS